MHWPPLFSASRVWPGLPTRTSETCSRKASRRLQVGVESAAVAMVAVAMVAAADAGDVVDLQRCIAKAVFQHSVQLIDCR